VNPPFGAFHMSKKRKLGLAVTQHFSDPSELAKAIEACAKLESELRFFPGGRSEPFKYETYEPDPGEDLVQGS
jgi:hypothetical protein